MMAESERIVEEWLDDDFGVDEQPFKVIIDSELYEDESSFEIRIWMHDKNDREVAEATVKATVTNPVELTISIPAIAVVYGTCVATRISYSTVDLILASHKDSKENSPDMTRWERCKDTVTRFSVERETLKEAAKGSLIKCLRIYIGSDN